MYAHFRHFLYFLARLSAPPQLLTGLNVTGGQFSRGSKVDTNEFTLASRKKVVVSAAISECFYLFSLSDSITKSELASTDKGEHLAAAT